jgi:hypothetical protein
VSDYLDRLRQALADLPADERDELLADVEISLLENPTLELGPPERFAQELRAAAGLEAAPAAVTRPSAWAHLRPHVESATRVAAELAPAWWVLRGYVAACALALLAGLNWSEEYALVPVRYSPAFGVLLAVAGVAASVWLGMKRLHGRRWLTALNVVLAVATVPILTQALDGRASLATVTEQYYTEFPMPDGLTVRGEEVRNIYPYDRDGKLLLDVLLYDDQGRPLDIGAQDPQTDPLRRYVFGKTGEPLRNAFPIRYFEPGTSKVADPDAAPKNIVTPEIATPPLKRP